jgi:methionyl-tRNA formyltransferase
LSHEILNEIKKSPLASISGIITSKSQFKISYSDKFKNYRHSDLVTYAKENDIPFYTLQDSMKESNLQNWKKNIKYDLVLVAGWYHMLPKDWVDKEICLGLHASLLPELRGGAPLVWAMLEGRMKTGVSLFQMNSLVDSGPVWIQEDFPINDSDYISDLIDKTSRVSIKIIKNLLENFNTIIPKIIDIEDSKHKIYPQRSPSDGELTDFSDYKLALRVIRAQSKPYPGAFIVQNSLKIHLWRANYLESKPVRVGKHRFESLSNYGLLHLDNGTLKVTEFDFEKL